VRDQEDILLNQTGCAKELLCRAWRSTANIAYTSFCQLVALEWRCCFQPGTSTLKSRFTAWEKRFTTVWWSYFTSQWDCKTRIL